MSGRPAPELHTLGDGVTLDLRQCPDCGSPLSISVVIREDEPEDTFYLEVDCWSESCGWHASVSYDDLGFQLGDAGPARTRLFAMMRAALQGPRLDRED